MEAVKGAKSAAIWVTTDSIPTNDNNNMHALLPPFKDQFIVNIINLTGKMVPHA